ncbi:hypothetical protein [Deefgea salmonis]|uniref:Uncharacterized protein n=1 Tax=Deefgea salmonis TaxID=2875502 RepID=A0ABS8BJL9_9NEIS|nr:hypothetical protein [Deefgea salmonis]MCB5195918.1 hypothetical protein [Deefgea salmonis]
MTPSEIADFLKTIGFTTAILIGTFAYLCKVLIEKWIGNDVANYKASLDRDHEYFKVALLKENEVFQRDLKSIAEHQIEEYKSSLEKERIRLQISYGGIFEKQANAIIELYRLTTEFEETINGALYEGSVEKNSSAEAIFNEKRDRLYSFLTKNRILIPEKIDGMLHDLQRKTYISVNNYRNADKYINRSYVNQDILSSMISRQEKAHDDLEKVKVIREELIIQIRKLIGTFGSNE